MDMESIFAKIVYELNYDFYNQTGDTAYFPLRYINYGTGFYMEFMGIQIYKYDEYPKYHEIDDVEPYYTNIITDVKREVNDILGSLKKWELE